MNLTPNALRALRLVDQHTPEYWQCVVPGQFAHLFWPGHPGHTRIGKVGHGVTTGVGMRLSAGGYLAKLCRAGYLRRYKRGYRLAEKGRQALAQAAAP